jgi:hypothetical protein
VNAVIDTAPANLNTLNELAAALGDDANYAATTTTALGNRYTKAETDVKIVELSPPTDISGKFDKTGGTISGAINVTGGIECDTDIKINGTTNLRYRLYKSSSFKAGIQAVTTAGDMITSSAIDNLAIRSQSDMLFAAGGATEAMRINSNAYVDMVGATQVRLSLGSVGTPGTNTCNWIRGNSGYLQYNSASSGHSWENAGQEKMRIDSAGRVTMPFQPAFRVGMTNNVATTTGTNPIPWDNDGIGNCFVRGGVTLSGDGRVTVPVAGIYSFQVKLRSESTPFGYVDLNINKNGASIARIYHNASPWGVYQEASVVSILVHMSANDYVETKLGTGTTSSSISGSANGVCWFMGHLIG